MATNTYVALDKVTVGTATNSITFTSIPQGYTDLVIVTDAGASVVCEVDLRVGNSSLDTGSNYSKTTVTGDGTTATSVRNSSQTYWRPNYNSVYDNANGKANHIFHFMNYSNTTTNKTMLYRGNSAAYGVDASVCLWRSTSAINIITLYASLPSNRNFLVGSTFSLYGIKAFAESTPKAVGGAVTSDATYWYHTFTNTGNFVPNQSLTCDYLVIGGGGSGGSGGGAGAYRTSLEASTLSLTAQNYTVIVGAGGVSEATTGGTYGTVGNDSVFSTITSNGGGYGGQIGTQTSPNKNGVSNGNASGGGCGTGQNATGGAAGTYGNKGGDGSATYPYPPAYGSGGGGGAGSAGGNGTSSKGGDGGAGKNTNSAWATVTGTGVSGYYAGGGCGYAEPGYAQLASGGSGGGGSAASPNGVISTGSGAAAISNLSNYRGGNGGSGIVIVRYAK